jgi:hypothetical protein
MKKHDSGKGRRAFLKTGAAIGAGAAASTLLPVTAAAGVAEGQETVAEKPKGYQLSQHVLDYYRTAKL